MSFLQSRIVLIVLAGVLFVVSSMVFVVDERQQALVLAFGKVDRVEKEPGIKFKLPPPFNTVEYFEKRLLPLETSPLEVTPLDDRRLVVDAVARWKIADPVQFRQAVRIEREAHIRLEKILNTSLRQVLGKQSSDVVLSGERAALMRSIRDATRVQSSSLGVEIVDVMIRRADLPAQNLSATFERMKAERQREAADERARGNEAAQKVRAAANRKAIELVSEARRSSAIVKGKADAERSKILAKAYNMGPEFFYFQRSLEAYKNTIGEDDSTLLMSMDSEFLKYFHSITGKDAR